MTDEIEVFAFTFYDPVTDEVRTGLSKRTRAGIEAIPGLVVIEGTGEMIDRNQLDDHGRYRPPVKT